MVFLLTRDSTWTERSDRSDFVAVRWPQVSGLGAGDAGYNARRTRPGPRL